MNLRVFYLTRRGLSDGYKAEPVFITNPLATPFLSPPPPPADTRKLPAATAFEGCRVGSFSEYGRKGAPRSHVESF